MKVGKAVITAAGRGQRHLPLQTVADRDGYPRTALELFLDELAGAGVESVALVVAPGDAELFRAAAGDRAGRLTFVEQTEARGYGHAVFSAREFVGEEPFLLMVSDHLYVSDDPERNCARQLVETAAAEACAVSAVQATHEGQLPYFGTVGGRLFEGREGLYAVERVREKPSPTRAEQELLVPGLRMGYYLCFFGMHVLPPEVMEILGGQVAGLAAGETLSLSPALDALAQRGRYLAADLRGRRFDLGQRHGLLIAQLALALAGANREEVLANLVELLAQAPGR